MNKIAGHGFPGSWAFDCNGSFVPRSILPRVFLVSPARLNNFQSRNRVGYIYIPLGEESNRPNIG